MTYEEKTKLLKRLEKFVHSRGHGYPHLDAWHRSELRDVDMQELLDLLRSWTTLPWPALPPLASEVKVSRAESFMRSAFIRETAQKLLVGRPELSVARCAELAEELMLVLETPVEKPAEPPTTSGTSDLQQLIGNIRIQVSRIGFINAPLYIAVKAIIEELIEARRQLAVRSSP